MKKNWFTKTLAVLFVVFLGLYIASGSGYYERSVNRSVVMTDDAIKQFERDILEGKNVDVSNYVISNNNDYSNKLTDTGEAISSAFEKFLTDGFGGVWDAIKVLFF